MPSMFPLPRSGVRRGPAVTPHTEHRLDHGPECVREARRLVRQAIRGLGGDDDAVDTGALLVSELVTNAVLHGRTGAVLRVLAAGGRARVCVVDGSPMSPRPRGYGVHESTGRGLRLVEGLAASWGVEADSAVSAGGKSVWFEIELHGSASSLDEAALLASFDLSDAI